MRVAVLADIHGNLPALEAVLRDVEAAGGVDAIVLNGDLADGPMPAQTLDRLEELGNRAI
jgi:predicted phosphodiesterase